MSTVAQWSGPAAAAPPSDVTAEMTDIEAHIQQTNDRLLCIQQQLGVPAESFQNAARELLEWCSDVRAFQPHFEQRLLGCLLVINQVAAQPGFDLDLGYRVLAVCSAHNDKFSQKSSGVLTSWCEELGRLLLVRHQNSRSAAVTSADCSTTQKQVGGVDSGMQWQHAGSVTAHHDPSLSSSTSGWGPAAGPPPSAAQPPSQAAAAAAEYGGVGGAARQFAVGTSSSTFSQRLPQGLAQQAANATFTDGPTAKYGVYGRPPGAVYPQHNGFLPLSSSDAMTSTTAACTAGTDDLCPQPRLTNTAMMNATPQMRTASQPLYPGEGAAVAYNSVYPSQQQYGPRPPGHMGPASVVGQHVVRTEEAISAGPGPMKGGAKATMFAAQQQQQRSAPYPHPHPHRYMQSRRPQFINGQVPEGGFGVGGQQFAVGPMGQAYGWPAGRPGCPPNYGVGQPRPNAGGPGYCSAPVQGVYMVPGQCRPDDGYQFVAGPGFPHQMYGGGQQLSPMMSGNPSKIPPAMASGGIPPSYGSMQGVPPAYASPTGVPPSYTSLAGVPPSYGSPPSGVGGDVKPVMLNGKMGPAGGGMPAVLKEESVDNMRLTFPVRDGVVLPPFRLEHNYSVSNHVFHLRESVFQTLMWRSDLELQLKCYHHEDRQMATNWPISVSISVNQTLLAIDRSVDSSACHRPLYLKDVCQPGRNTIQITVSACCCSHLFVLQLVHRPSVKSVLQGLLRKRLLPAEHCIAKIKRTFMQPGVLPATGLGSGPLEKDVNDQNLIKLSLKCPITYRKIGLPARGHDCKHVQCFDLDSYLQLNCERGLWRCPVCNKSALLEGLEIDQYIWGILKNLSGTEFEEVTLDSTASWKPVPLKSVKEEDAKQWTKAVSPCSMNLPTMTSWQDNAANFMRAQSSVNQQHPQQQQQHLAMQGNYDRGQGASPCFSPLGSPDFLSSLSHMGDSLIPNDAKAAAGTQPMIDSQLRQPRTPSDGQLSGGHLRHPPDQPPQVMHPRTPLDGQMCQNPRTPIEAQMIHPRTPMDGQFSSQQLRTPLEGQLMHPRTPLDGQVCNYPQSVGDGQAALPRTPMDGGQHPPSVESTRPSSSDAAALRPTPGTPGSNPRTPSTGGRSYPSSTGCTTSSTVRSGCTTLSHSSISSAASCSSDSSRMPTTTTMSTSANDTDILSANFSFDPTGFGDSDGHGPESLDLDGIDDPTELLSYLGPSADTAGTGIGGSSNPDDLLSLFT